MPLPRRRRVRRQNGLPTGLVWSMIATGVVAVGAIIGLVVWTLTRTPNNEQAKVEPPPRKIEDVAAPIGVAPVNILGPDLTPHTDGSLSDAARTKVKSATVYIRVTRPDGGMGSGSGFFETSSNMVITNAHVLGMLHEEAKPPRKIEVIVNSGERTELILRGTIAGVDRGADLAVLSTPPPPPQTQSLTVISAMALRETQELYVAGFPLGEGLSKNITISKTSVSNLHKGPDGLLQRLQVNGGMVPGNSGGPVVDSRGNVVGVAVAIIVGTQLNFAIPGEHVHSTLHGYVTDIRVREETVTRDGKFYVKVHVSALDPLRRLKRVALDYWTGPPLPLNFVPPIYSPKPGPGCSARQTAEVTIQSSETGGDAELALDQLPESGKVLWVQPMVVRASQSIWMSGTSYPLEPPVEARPAVLAVQQHPGKIPVQLKSTLKIRLEDGKGKEMSGQRFLDTRLIENTTVVDPAGATVLLTVDKFAVGQSQNGRALEPPDNVKKALAGDVNTLGIEMKVDPRGNILSKKNQLARVPPDTREVVTEYGDQIQHSLDLAAIPLPGGMMQPGQTWTAKRLLPIDAPGAAKQSVTLNMTYTHRGVRQHNGREVAVLEIRGIINGAGALKMNDETTGSALVDLATGIVVQSKTMAIVTVSVHIKDETLEARYVLDTSVERAENLK